MRTRRATARLGGFLAPRGASTSTAPVRPSLPPCAAIPFVTALLGACGLFQELQSADSASTGSSSSSGSSGADGGSGGGCEIATEDRCDNQDTLSSCDPVSGEVTVYSCTDVCGDNLNFSCLRATAEGQHACWCVAPGNKAQLACVDLEGCLRACSDDPAASSSCPDECFARASSGTIRAYGALVFCANEYCNTSCQEDPASCSQCIEEAIMFGGGDCTLERALCDDDSNDDDPWWP